jgi:multimeric flavodoxin WrbA
MKKVVLINGSPRKNRACNFLIDQAIKGIKSTSEDIKIEKLQIVDYNLTPCNGCDQCLRSPNDCPLAENDDTKKLEDVILDCDAMIIAAPNYFGSVSSQIKTFIDRSRPWKMKNYLFKDTILAPMAATGLRNGGEGVISDLINFGIIQGMIIVGNTLGSPVLEGNVAITSIQKHSLKDFLAKGEIDELAGLIAEDTGKRVAELVNKVKK